ncbi:MAG TPA: hypothetical protein VM328_05110 [Fimbriimonadaceae bacterium]|nr:hypothetical protein [Fimbriimonadaceae bacterium]
MHAIHPSTINAPARALAPRRPISAADNTNAAAEAVTRHGSTQLG